VNIPKSLRWVTVQGANNTGKIVKFCATASSLLIPVPSLRIMAPFFPCRAISFYSALVTLCVDVYSKESCDLIGATQYKVMKQNM